MALQWLVLRQEVAGFSAAAPQPRLGRDDMLEYDLRMECSSFSKLFCSLPYTNWQTVKVTTLVSSTPLFFAHSGFATASGQSKLAAIAKAATA